MRSTTRTVTLAATEAQGTALQLDSRRKNSGRLPAGNDGWPGASTDQEAFVQPQKEPARSSTMLSDGGITELGR